MASRLIPDSAAPKQLKLFWLDAGNRDPLMRVSQGLHTFLTEKDVPHIWRPDGNADTAVMSADFCHFHSASSKTDLVAPIKPSNI